MTIEEYKQLIAGHESGLQSLFEKFSIKGPVNERTVAKALGNPEFACAFSEMINEDVKAADGNPIKDILTQITSPQLDNEQPRILPWKTAIIILVVVAIVAAGVFAAMRMKKK